MRSLLAILYVLSDEKSILLFRAIALNKFSTDLKTELGLSPKQYYSRLSLLIEVGLVKRTAKTHYLTSIGKLTFGILTLLEDLLQDDNKLKAIDSLHPSHNLSVSERNKVINTLVEASQIKRSLREILFNTK